MRIARAGIISHALLCLAFECLVSRSASAQFVVTTLAGLSGSSGSANGTGSVARFNRPWGTAVDSSGTVYVADSDNSLVRQVTPTGAATTFATGSSTPSGVAVDSSGTVYVAYAGSSYIRKLTPAGVSSNLAGLSGAPGFANGTGTTARFNAPYGIATDPSGTVYVADTFNNAIRKITPAGAVITMAGTGGFGADDGPGATATFVYPAALAVNSSGTVFVADLGNSLIRRITPEGYVSTIATTACYGITLGPSGTLYVADGVASIIAIAPDGVVTTIAGGAVTGAVDGVALNARFNKPTGIVCDPAGRLFVGDYNNHTIRQLTPPVTIVLVATNRFSGTNIYYSLINGGIVAPANTNATGALSLAPINYQQTTGGVLQIQLGGTNAALATNGYDQLNCSGNVELNGMLVVSNFAGFAPRTGDVFSIVSGTSLSGTFATSRLPALATGAIWGIAYGATSVALQVGFQNNSVLNPAGTNTTGALSFTPFFAQSSAGFLQIELGGTNAGATLNGHDRLQSAGSAQLDGTLAVSLVSNFVPQAGNRFAFIDAKSIAGRFATTNLPAPPAGVGWMIDGNSTQVVLKAGTYNDDLVNPGGTNITGTLNAANFYTQTSNGTLRIEIGGTVQGISINGYDFLTSPGPVQLAGALFVTNIYGFTAQTGQTFTIISGMSVSGTFSSITLPPLAEGMAWAVTNDGNSVSLSVISAQAVTNFAAWTAAITNGLTNFNDSTTGDGYPNLLKYATGSSPTNADLLAHVSAARTNGLLALRFNRNTNAADVTLVVEGAWDVSNGSAWNGIATNIGGIWGAAPGVDVTETGGTNPVPTRVADGQSAGTNRFLRLRVTIP